MENVKATQVLLERLITTNGLSVRNSNHDKAFWYTSGKPGPFYINTENIAGKNTADFILNRVTKLLQEDILQDEKVEDIFKIIDRSVENDKSYSDSIDALLDYYVSQSSYSPSMISGGERRDWFFSIPIAKKLKIPHIFLFKSGEYHISDHKGKKINISIDNENVLHVADIINQASSYEKKWIPILKSTGAKFTETLSVAVRNEEGVNTLKKNNITVLSPIIVDRELFTVAYDLGLISEFSLKEINLFYDAPKAWTINYLSENNYDSHQNRDIDPVKKERIEFFKSNDPYDLKGEFPSFFN